MTIEVRDLAADDWQLLRDLRLAALADSPGAFASTLERERALDPDAWRDRAGSSAVACLDGDPVGLVGAVPDEGADDTLLLVGTWVAPGARRRGVGRALVGHVLDRAAVTDGIRVVALSVVRTNEEAVGLYRAMGFMPTGRTAPLPSDPEVTEERMVRSA